MTKPLHFPTRFHNQTQSLFVVVVVVVFLVVVVVVVVAVVVVVVVVGGSVSGSAGTKVGRVGKKPTVAGARVAAASSATD